MEMLGSSSFTPKVDESMPPKGFKLPTMESYDGTVDLIDHLEMFCISMSIQGVGDAIMCKAFPATLKKVTMSWFSSLPPRSISIFKKLRKKFVSHFKNSIAHKKTSITLMSIRQRQDEPLREFVTRFNNETLQVKDFNHIVAIAAFTNDLRDKDFTKSLIKKPPKVFADLLLRAKKYINTKKAMAIKYQSHEKVVKYKNLPPIHTIKTVKKRGPHYHGKGELSNSSSANEERCTQEG